ncbi:helix-turn-helix domain-containing protein [Ruegeria sp. SCPT10]|uniref:helix-turn-helix domain-containing protein n=1 Tax=Ruegeria sp. SCP10 TaxID=3141377 RepID=UPI003337462B
MNLVHELDAIGASLRVLEPEVSTAGEMGRMVITVLGIVAAKGKGVYKGRRKSVDDGEIRKLVDEGISKAQIAGDLGVSRMTVKRALVECRNRDGRKIKLLQTRAESPKSTDAARATNVGENLLLLVSR